MNKPAATFDRASCSPALPGKAPRLSALLDGLSNFVIASLAVWTLLYHVGLFVHVGTNALFGVWAVASLLIAVASVRASAARVRSVPTGPAPALLSWPLILIAASFAIAAAVCAAAATSGQSAWWWPAWGLAVIAAVTAAGSLAPRQRPCASEPELVPSLGATLLAVTAAIGFAVFSLFNFKPDGDDTYYINHAQWVADHGTLSTRDTLFTSQQLPVIRGTGEPVSSIEALEGAVAHLAHIEAGSIAYYVTCPLGTFLAVWALWRLVRSFAPRRLPLCFCVALCYLVYAAVSPPMLGDFFASRMQAGKVVFVAMLVPLLYTYLVRWGERGGRPEAFRLVAGGMAGVGLSSTATLVIPLISTAVAVPLLIRREVRHAAGCYFAAVYPLIVGVAVRLAYGSGDNSGFHDTRATFGWTFGPSWYAAIGLLALLLGFAFARRGMPQLTIIGISIVTLIVLAPGVLPLARSLIGSGPVLWRTMWVVPLPALVGIAAAVRLPARLAWAAPVPAALLVALLIATGLPFWSSAEGVTLTSPRWRIEPAALAKARAVVKWYDGPGPIYGPPYFMRAIAFVTTDVHAVDPRYLYLQLQTEPSAQHRARLELANLMQTAPRGPIPANLREDLALLRVDLVCFPPAWQSLLSEVRQAGYPRETRVGGLVCLRP